MFSNLFVVCPFAILAMALPAQAPRQLSIEGRTLDYRVHEPEQCGPDGFAPLVLLCGDVTAAMPAARAACDDVAAALVADGCIVVRPQAWSMHPGSAAPHADSLLQRLPAVLRQEFAIAGGGMHLVALEHVAGDALQLATAAPFEFRSVTTCGIAPAAVDVPSAVQALLKSRLRERVAGLADADPAAVARHLRTARAAWLPAGPAGEVSHALDRFHDAAAKGDEVVYFALLPDDAVFLGTDATERWTGAEFRKFALPYFERGPAWIYVPTSRHVTMLPGNATAMFDEMLDNEAYGECRGSGVLERRADRWVVRQYNLSIPIPNDLARGVVARIRAFAAETVLPRATVVLVRHAEKTADGSNDPELTEAGKARAERLAQMLADLPVTAVFATEYRRTQATVAPLAAARGLQPSIVQAAETKALARTLRREHASGTAVVAAHSNTIPALLKALGCADSIAIADDDYGDLFVVTFDGAGAHLLRLHY